MLSQTAMINNTVMCRYHSSAIMCSVVTPQWLKLLSLGLPQSSLPWLEWFYKILEPISSLLICNINHVPCYTQRTAAKYIEYTLWLHLFPMNQPPTCVRLTTLRDNITVVWLLHPGRILSYHLSLSLWPGWALTGHISKVAEQDISCQDVHHATAMEENFASQKSYFQVFTSAHYLLSDLYVSDNIYEKDPEKESTDSSSDEETDRDGQEEQQQVIRG